MNDVGGSLATKHTTRVRALSTEQCYAKAKASLAQRLDITGTHNFLSELEGLVYALVLITRHPPADEKVADHFKTAMAEQINHYRLLRQRSGAKPSNSKSTIVEPLAQEIAGWLGRAQSQEPAL